MSVQTPIRMAILGCGGMAGGHAQHFAAHPDVELVALCDVSEEVVQGFIERNLSESNAKPQIFTDAATMYEEARPDAVTIVTPHTMHFDHGKQAIEAGCHVFMEKPMVTDSTQAHELAKLVEESGKIFVIGYNSPCSPQYHYIRELIRNKELGNLETVTMWMTQDWKRPTAGTWRQKPELSGGGQMYDSGAHVFNSLVWSVEQPVAEVFAFVDNLGAPVDINGTANIRFEDGTLAVVTIVGNCPTGAASACYSFDNGRIEVNPWTGADLRVWKGTEEIEPELEGQVGLPGDNFIDAILGRTEPRTSPKNGVMQSELMDAIYQSAQTGQVAKVAR